MKSPIGFDRDQEPSDDLQGTRADGQLWALAWVCSTLIEVTGQREGAKEYIQRFRVRLDEVSVHTTEEYRKGVRDVLRRVENLLRSIDH